MRIAVNRLFGQLILILFIITLCECTFKKEEAPIIPPETNPLSKDYIGFGVITASFTHINSDPVDDSPSLGYLRRGTLVRIIRRQDVKTGSRFQSWVMIDGDDYGWLKEEAMTIYNSESQARTASESIHR